MRIVRTGWLRGQIMAAAMVLSAGGVPWAWGAESLEKVTRKGPVQVTVHLAPPDPAIGDSVTLTIHVVAEKEVELLMPEFGEALERFAITDFAIREGIDDEGRTVVSQAYELEPPRSGRQSIPPIMVEFIDRRQGAKAAPEGLDAYELLTERLGFEVKSVLPKDAEADLNPPLGKLPPLAQTQTWPWAWITGAVVLIGMILPAWRFWLTARRKARQRSAFEIAMERLARLLADSGDDPQGIDGFFVELSAIVRWYLENRFDMRAPELTTEEFLELMSRSPDLSDDHQPLLRDFLQQADLVKFAHLRPSRSDIDESVSAARRFLEETREVSESRIENLDSGQRTPAVDAIVNEVV